MISIDLPDAKQRTLLQQYIDYLDPADKLTLEQHAKATEITALVDGRGLACPMPLLKTKVALRSMQDEDSVYVLATDPNSQVDLAAFCQQSGLKMVMSTQSCGGSTDSLEKLDTIFHVMITKTNGN